MFLIAVMGMLTLNQSANLHTHILNDGTIVTHAHPYQKANDTEPVTSHSHSMKEYTFIHQLNILFSVVFIALAILLFPICHRNITERYFHKEKCDSRLILGRAPPVFNSL